MRRGAAVTALVFVAVIVLIVWPRWGKQSISRQSQAHPADVVSNPVRGVKEFRRASDSATNLPPSGFADDSRPAVQRLYEFSKAARLYNFDSRITGYRKEKSPRSEDYEVIGTPTHVAQVIDGKLIAANSLYLGSDTRRKPEALNGWYEATGTWTKEAAIEETMNILRRLGHTNTLNQVMGGAHEYQAIEMTVRTPDGAPVRVIPFPTVRLYDTNKLLRVIAEFRMGPTGVLGLTEWFSL